MKNNKFIMKIRNTVINYRKAEVGILLGCLLLCLGGCGRQETVPGQTESQMTGQNISNAVNGQSQTEDDEMQSAATGQGTAGIEWSSPERVALSYAQEFTLDRYSNGASWITISDGSQFLVVPEELAEVSDEELLRGIKQSGETVGSMAENEADNMTESGAESMAAETITVVRQPVDRIYLVASAVMDMFSTLDGLDRIRLSGMDTDDWYIEEARAAMEEGSILYAGKYSAPDYELILSEDCDLVIENTMIDHSPEVKENLMSFGIPVLVDHSSYENHPLGRVEWIKLYGTLLGKEEEAAAVFEKQEKILAEVEQDIALNQDGERPAVAFFYITNNGAANVRKSSDYVPKMIELAGGTYIYSDLGETESHASSMTMQIEEFYATAKDADYIIYNSAVDGEVRSLEELFAKCELLADFKAVQEGHVYCTTKNLYQESMAIGDLIRDMHVMMTDGDEVKQMQYLYPVN